MNGGAGAGGAGGGCGGRGLKLLLLAVLALAAVEYMFGSILETSTGTLRSYLYTPPPAAVAPSARTGRSGDPWPKRTQSRPISSDSPEREPTEFTLPANATAQSHAGSTQPTNATGTAETDKSNLLVVKIKNSLQVIPVGGDEKANETEAKVKLKACSPAPPDLGPVTPNTTEVSLQAVEELYPEVQLGGRYAPTDCRPLHKVAIVIPYRDREQHLAIFLRHMHPFLMSQKLDYGIFVVEQKGDQPFNRAKLMNVGFAEAQRLRAGGWDCFVFHDIDLLPLDARNVYSCPRQPRHMSVAIDKYNFKMPYSEIFGGVSAMTVAQVKAVNGFSNKYWGWGGEDDDMFYRLKKNKFHIARYPMSVARYTMLKHKSQTPNPKRYQLLAQTNKLYKTDGISSLEYVSEKTARHRLYTHVLANIDEHS